MSVDKDYFGGWTVNDADVRAWWRKKGFTLFGVICLALLLSLGLCSKAQSAPLVHPTAIQELFVTAVKLGGYHEKCMSRRGGCPMPEIVLSGIDDSNVLGQFDPSHPTFIRVTATATPGSLGFNAILVHEFVHYLQWLFGDLGPESGCLDVPRIEGQAYKAAAAYLASFGIIYDYSDQMASIQMMAVMCEASGGM